MRRLGVALYLFTATTWRYIATMRPSTVAIQRSSETFFRDVVAMHRYCAPICRSVAPMYLGNSSMPEDCAPKYTCSATPYKYTAPMYWGIATMSRYIAPMYLHIAPDPQESVALRLHSATLARVSAPPHPAVLCFARGCATTFRRRAALSGDNEPLSGAPGRRHSGVLDRRPLEA